MYIELFARKKKQQTNVNCKLLVDFFYQSQISKCLPYNILIPLNELTAYDIL